MLFFHLLLEIHPIIYQWWVKLLTKTSERTISTSYRTLLALFILNEALGWFSLIRWGRENERNDKESIQIHNQEWAYSSHLSISIKKSSIWIFCIYLLIYIFSCQTIYIDILIYILIATHGTEK